MIARLILVVVLGLTLGPIGLAIAAILLGQGDSDKGIYGAASDAIAGKESTTTGKAMGCGCATWYIVTFIIGLILFGFFLR